MSRSTATPILSIFVSRGVAQFPSFIDLAQRHFEKEMPAGRFDGVNRIFTVPVDLLRLVLPEDLTEDIAEVEIVYGKR